MASCIQLRREALDDIKSDRMGGLQRAIRLGGVNRLYSLITRQRSILSSKRCKHSRIHRDTMTRGQLRLAFSLERYVWIAGEQVYDGHHVPPLSQQSKLLNLGKVFLGEAA